MAKTTSENKNNAMIIGVGTIQNTNSTYATKCLIKICNELIEENKIPCLFCDNEAASIIYKMLGFLKKLDTGAYTENRKNCKKII